jgi:hypothetical protein
MIRFVPASNIISHLQSSRKPRRISKRGGSFWSNKTEEKFMKSSHRMLAEVPVATLFLLVTALSAMAQDVVKVSPETHKVLLENERVWVLGVRVKPGEKIGMHSHPPNVVYFLTDGTIRFNLP